MNADFLQRQTMDKFPSSQFFCQYEHVYKKKINDRFLRTMDKMRAFN